MRAGVVLFKALGTEGPGTVDLGIRLPPGRVRTEASNDVKVRSAAFTLATGLEWGVHVGVQRSDRILGEHADDRVGLAPEQDGPPKDALVGAENAAPQAVAENSGLGPVGTVLVLRKIAPDDGLKSQHVEVVSGDAPVMHVLHVRTSLEVDARGASRNRGDQCGNIVAQQFPLLTVNARAFVVGAGTGHALVNRAHPLRMRIGQVLQHERIHQREDRCIRADGERQSDNDRYCKSGITP